ncbi:hypothetical protein ACFPZ0_02590 [Streptomonospora nanhaiensis]|uniref:Uncharacterized protein n=1 Tax=Streptomonospora nanhaiensis TaxID=1323731 RepID=A0A853BV48_9ACTN|nr:hypothetical protein [Streptomonospora nanhaiensis]MBX9386831.1 hypothetical protein [Streptomonospora nanhaiensis]NYI98102.1 hypothetical protein [Streptomonospora nanhaiensis]
MTFIEPGSEQDDDRGGTGPVPPAADSGAAADPAGAAGATGSARQVPPR